jgi:hypothetical protein
MTDGWATMDGDGDADAPGDDDDDGDDDSELLRTQALSTEHVAHTLAYRTIS